MLTSEEFRLFQGLIYSQSGICLKDSRKDFLEHRLAKRMAATGVSSPYWYYKLVTEEKASELLILLDLLTVNETSFFRNRPQLDLFRNVILPEVMRSKSRDIRKKLRIWSAGCSTGEEPYTVSMIVRDTVPNIPEWDIKIFASDISLRALETATRGHYNAEKVLEHVPPAIVARHFESFDVGYIVKEEIKKLVVFDYHNLKNDNGLRELDVIFCRNVMIYFDQEEQLRLVSKFHQGLSAGGYLLIGHAESLQGLNSGFDFFYSDKGTAYRKH